MSGGPIAELDWPKEPNPFLVGNITSQRLYGRFKRRTIGAIEHTANEQPLAANYRQHASFAVEERIEVDRRYQPICRFGFEVPATKNGTAAAGAPEPKGISRLAFTLAVVIQDVARSLFPRWAHRLFAVSPQSESGLPLLGHQQRRQKVSLANGTGSADVDEVLARVYPGLVVPPTGPGTPITGVDVLLLEDSDFDLGIVRALTVSPRVLYEEAIAYLRWLERNNFRNDYHRFGGTADASMLDLKAALSMFSEAGGSEVHKRKPARQLNEGPLPREVTANTA